MVTSGAEKTADRAPEKEALSPAKDASSITETPEFKKALTDALNAARGEDGWKHKQTLQAAQRKWQAQKDEEMADLQTENQKLQKMLDDLANDDDDKARLASYLKENKRMQSELKKKDAEWGERIARVEEVEISNLCVDIAKDFDGGDAARLKRIALRTKFSEDEPKADQIRDLASDIWPKRTTQELPKKVDSGVTIGSTGIPAKKEDFNKWVSGISHEEYLKRRPEIMEALNRLQT